jgi:hypothetical protein
MRQIFKNRFIKSYLFRSADELSRFIQNLGSVKDLWLDDSIGENYICYVCRNSLTRKVLFCLSFCTESQEDDLNFIYWHDSKLMVIETGKWIYLINEDLSIIKSLEITSPIVGLLITNGNKLLILEETYVRLVDFEGTVLMEQLFDLIEDFDFNGNTLTVKTAEGTEVVRLQ